MAGRIDEVELVGLAVVGRVVDVRDDGEVADEVRIGGHSLSFK